MFFWCIIGFLFANAVHGDVANMFHSLFCFFLTNHGFYIQWLEDANVMFYQNGYLSRAILTGPFIYLGAITGAANLQNKGTYN